MRRYSLPLLALVLLQAACVSNTREPKWTTLFDGSSLEGWKSNEETPDVFHLTENGELEVRGGRAHLFWMGREGIPADFRDFEMSLMVKTTPKSNSGIFFHTEYQERGWPQVGLEAQINSTHRDRRKTGSVYALKDVEDHSPSIDGEWFEYRIHVEGKTVTLSVNGEVVNVYEEPEDLVTPEDKARIRLGHGTFAIQGHDPKSVIYYRDIKIRW